MTFEEGSDASGADLDAAVAGVKLARGLTHRLAAWGAQEIYPGPDVDTDDEIRQYVRDNAWGHHACGTCAIGPSGDPNAVIDSQFRVRGVPGLRVVDASVFPRIPGYFIVTAVYMISEKAADVILADAALVPAPQPTNSQGVHHEGSPAIHDDREACPAWWVRGASAAAQAVDQWVGWDRLPKPLGLLVLIGLQSILRQKNLHDTGRGPVDEPAAARHVHQR